MTSGDESTRPVYLDYAATTPVAPSVARAMAGCLTLDGVFANPASSGHSYGREARERVEAARAQVADVVGARAGQVVWTSGATESNNLAILGIARHRRGEGCHIVTCRTEHKAVLDVCRHLESTGVQVTYLVPDRKGLVDPESVRKAIRADTGLVSVMHVNNEIGVIQDIAAIGAICAQSGVPFHVDAAQSAGKLPFDLSELPVDFMSFSAHKTYGPKGVGALYVASESSAGIEPVLFGGGQERGLRPGTLATHQIVGMGEAFRLAGQAMADDHRHLVNLRRRLMDGLDELDGWQLNGHTERVVPGIVNISFEGVEGESLVFALSELAVSSGSACSSALPESSYVLRALGRPDHLAGSSVRLSFGRYTTEAEIDKAVCVVLREVGRLRRLSGVDRV